MRCLGTRQLNKCIRLKIPEPFSRILTVVAYIIYRTCLSNLRSAYIICRTCLCHLASPYVVYHTCLNCLASAYVTFGSAGSPGCIGYIGHIGYIGQIMYQYREHTSCKINALCRRGNSPRQYQEKLNKNKEETRIHIIGVV